MTPLKFLAPAVAGFALFTATQAAANLYLNPGFETDAVLDQPLLPGATDWLFFGNANTASANLDPVRTGIGSLALVGAGAFGVPGAYQTFPASPGQIWDLQGYMLTPDPLPADITFGLLKIAFDDGAVDLEPAAVLIGQAGPAANPGVEALPLMNSASAADTWQFAHAQGVAPPGTVNARLFALFVDQSAGAVYFDDLRATLVGDFDNDVDVDDDDLLLWRGAFGQTAVGDADGDNHSDGADFLLWQRNLFIPAAASAVGAVPEPCSVALLAVGLALAGRRRLNKFGC